MSAHHDEQQDIENAKQLWHSGGKWVFAALVAAACAYLGHVVYHGQVTRQNAEAAKLAAQVQGDAAKLQALQQNHPKSAAAAVASMETAATAFAAGRHDEAAAAYRWVLTQHKDPLFQAAAARNLANVYLQQQKYNDALAALETPVETVYRPLLDETKGDIYAAQGKNQEAAAAYQAALEQLPETSEARALLELKAAAL